MIWLLLFRDCGVPINTTKMPVKAPADMFDTANMHKAETVSIGAYNKVKLGEQEI